MVMLTLPPPSPLLLMARVVASDFGDGGASTLHKQQQQRQLFPLVSQFQLTRWCSSSVLESEVSHHANERTCGRPSRPDSATSCANAVVVAAHRGAPTLPLGLCSVSLVDEPFELVADSLALALFYTTNKQLSRWPLGENL